MTYKLSSSWLTLLVDVTVEIVKDVLSIFVSSVGVSGVVISSRPR